MNKKQSKSVNLFIPIGIGFGFIAIIIIAIVMIALFLNKPSTDDELSSVSSISSENSEDTSSSEMSENIISSEDSSSSETSIESTSSEMSEPVVEEPQVPVSLSLYKPYIETAISDVAYADSYGTLYDLDGNGVEELIMTYMSKTCDKCPDMPALVCCVYTIDNGAVVPIWDKECIYVDAGGPSATFYMINQDGKNYFTVYDSNYNGCHVGNWCLYEISGTTININTEIYFSQAFIEEDMSTNYETSTAKLNHAQWSYTEYENWANTVNKTTLPLDDYLNPESLSLSELYNSIE